jgi:hypothetical protein
VKARTGLVCPVIMATAWKVPQAPAGSDPAQPDGLVALRFHEIVSSCGTPRWNLTVLAAGGLHPAESHTTWPFLVTITRTDPAPYAIWHWLAAVETA